MEMLTISVTREDVDFVKLKGFKPSHIYRRAVGELRDCNTVEDYQKRMIGWKKLYDFAMNFIKRYELDIKYLEDLQKWNKKNL